MKICKTCGVAKPDSEFHKHPTATDLLRTDCKACRNQHMREAYRTDAYKQTRMEYRSTEEYRQHKAAYMREYHRRKKDKSDDR